MRNYLILLLFSLNTSAGFFDWFKSKPKVPDHAASTQDVYNISCSTGKLGAYLSNDFYADYFNKYREGRTSSLEIIHRKKFYDQPDRMSKLYDDLIGFRKVRAFSHCTSLECKMESLLGASYLHKLAYILDNFSFNASYISHRKGTGMFTESELDTIIWAFRQLPSFLYPKQTKNLIRDSKEHTGMYASVLGFMERGTGHMTLFRTWIKSSKAMKAYTVIHEFGHLIGEKLNIHNSYDWVEMSEWNKIEGNEKNYHIGLISEYARGNHLEDFAETFSAYRLNPSFLMERAPQKYELMKNMIFQGIDYHRASCESNYVETLHDSENLNIDKVLGECSIPVMGYQIGRKSRELAKSCIESNLDLIALSEFEAPGNQFDSKLNELNERNGFPFLHFNDRSDIVEKIMDIVDGGVF